MYAHIYTYPHSWAQPHTLSLELINLAFGIHHGSASIRCSWVKVKNDDWIFTKPKATG